MDNAQFFQLTLEHLPVPVLLADRAGTITFVNAALESLLGRDRRRLLGSRLCQLFGQADPALCAAAADAEGGFCAPLQTPAPPVNGRTAVLLPGLLGSDMAHVVWTLEEVSDERHTHASLLQTKKELNCTQVLGAVGSWDWDIATGRVWWSDGMYRIFGRRRETFQPTYASFMDFVDPDDRPAIAQAIAEATRKDYSVRHRIVRKDGSRRILHGEGRLLRGADGAPQHLVGIAQDITDLVNTEERLHRSEEQWHQLFELASDALFVVTPEGKVAQSNTRAAQLLGYAKEELAGKPIDALIAEKDQPWIDWACGLVQAGAVDVHLDEWQLRRQDGRLVDVEVSACRLPDGRAIASARDISKRREAETRLRFQARLLDMVGQGVIAIDREARVVFLNGHAQRLYGVTPPAAIGQSLDKIEPSLAFKLSEALPRVLEGESWEGEVETRYPDGTVLLVAIAARPVMDEAGNIVGAVATCTDITERRKWEAERIRVQKSESIAALAGGIAHDFNNLLTAILGYVTLAKMHAQPGDSVHENLSAAEQAFWRAQKLTRQLLTFAKGGEPVTHVGSLVALLNETPALVLAGSNVLAEAMVPDDLWPVSFDAGQLSQVLSNLVLNAKQAMGTGGSVRIRASNAVLEPSAPQPLPPGRYVKIEVQDSGIGIPAEALPHIFEPYFTTKPDGMGLGLASSYSIIKRHRGHIEVESTPGQGTLASLYLPAALDGMQPQVQEPGAPLRSTEGTPIDVRPAGQGRLLVMDDEATVTTVVAAMLRSLGYEVDTAARGEEAVQLYREALGSNPYRAVLLDLTVVGGMGAQETLAQLKVIDPDVRAIVSSGYATNPVLVEYRKYGFAGWIAKPYELDGLRDAVAAATGGSAVDSGTLSH